MASTIRTERPVVLIGAGGTGKETLLFLRRMFFERYGVKTLPHVAQLCIDTDGRKVHLDESDYDEFAREVDFEDEEFVVAPVGNALDNIRDNRSQHEHIDSWLDRALDNFGDIGHGAGQVRSLGRLAFFHNYRLIHDRLQRAYAKVTDRKALNESLAKYNIAMDPNYPGVETWLIFSVAGGTGAGMFLDLAFLAKRIAGNFGGREECRSVILLPTAFSSKLPQELSTQSDHRVFANAYAALMELETYNYRRDQDAGQNSPSRFSIQWTPEQFRQRISEVGPVFDNSWLIDNEPRGGVGKVNGERMSLCHMIAEWLFLQYGATAPALAGAILSNRSNDNQRLVELGTIRIGHDQSGGQRERSDPDDREEDVTLLFSQRYSSFGLSKIYVPTTNLARQAYARLVGDLARSWLADHPAGDLRQRIAGMQGQLLIPANASVSGLTREMTRRLSLDGAREPLSRRFDRLIQDKFQALKGVGFRPGAEAESRDWFQLEVMTKLLDRSEGAIARRGEISRAIAPGNIQAAGQEIRTALDQLIAQLLRTQGERLRHADALLRLLVKDYGQMAQQAEGQAQRLEADGRTLQTELEQLLGWAGDYRGFDRAKIFEAAFAKMQERANAEFRRQVFLATAALATEIAGYIGVGHKETSENGEERIIETGLLRTLQVLRETFQFIERRSGERIMALRAQPTSSLNLRAPATDDDSGAAGPDAELDQLYRDAEGKRIDQERLQAYEDSFYVAFAQRGISSPWDLRSRNDSGSRNDVFEDMLTFASRELGHLPSRMEDALLRFDRKTNRAQVEGRYNTEVDLVASRGTPWLPRYEHNIGGAETWKQIPGVRYLAVSGSADPGARRSLIDRVRDRQIVNGQLDTVYFEGELAGVPLCTIRHLDLYRNAYLGYLNADGATTRVVHNELDLEKFVDLIPYSSTEMESRRQAIRSFVRGMVTGVIVRDDAARTRRAEWLFYEVRPNRISPDARRLGSFRTAVQRLAQPDSTLRGAINREIDARYASGVSYDDMARIYVLLDRMRVQPPVGGNEWTTAIDSVMADMTKKFDDLIEHARVARPNVEAWAETVPSGSEHPFWRLKGRSGSMAG